MHWQLPSQGFISTALLERRHRRLARWLVSVPRSAPLAISDHPHPGAALESNGHRKDAAHDDAVFEHVVVLLIPADGRAFGVALGIGESPALACPRVAFSLSKAAFRCFSKARRLSCKDRSIDSDAAVEWPLRFASSITSRCRVMRSLYSETSRSARANWSCAFNMRGGPGKMRNALSPQGSHRPDGWNEPVAGLLRCCGLVLASRIDKARRLPSQGKALARNPAINAIMPETVSQRAASNVPLAISSTTLILAFLHLSSFFVHCRPRPEVPACDLCHRWSWQGRMAAWTIVVSRSPSAGDRPMGSTAGRIGSG
jgi:hypothetical protein